MNLYKITSPKYEGEIEVMYSDTLLKMDFSYANIQPQLKHAFKQLVPVMHSTFLEGKWCSPEVKVVAAEYEVSFADFWQAYGRKINKIRAEKLFAALAKIDKVQAVMGIKNYDAYLGKEKWRTKADPETYLRNRMWENEY